MADGDESEIETNCSRLSASSLTTCGVDIERIILSERLSRYELLLRFLSLACISLMFGLFLVQLDLAWKSRAILMELGVDDAVQQFLYPDFYLDAHSEDTWTWDPQTMLLRVNTSFFVH